MDKPNVARKIVRAIRQGHPPGRYVVINFVSSLISTASNCCSCTDFLKSVMMASGMTLETEQLLRRPLKDFVNGPMLKRGNAQH